MNGQGGIKSMVAVTWEPRRSKSIPQRILNIAFIFERQFKICYQILSAHLAWILCFLFVKDIFTTIEETFGECSCLYHCPLRCITNALATELRMMAVLIFRVQMWLKSTRCNINTIDFVNTQTIWISHALQFAAEVKRTNYCPTVKQNKTLAFTHDNLNWRSLWKRTSTRLAICWN